MKSFLNIVAEGYLRHYSDLSSLTFIMPNKRSGSFLMKAFSDLSQRVVVAPRIMPVSDFIASVSDFVPDSRIDLLFRLYKCYAALPQADPSISFDKFCSWGETILSDFNEIDMQMVDADEIFKNVFDLNAIRSNFLSSAQRTVMVDYFGYSPEMLEANFSRFWQKFDVEGGEVKRKFFALWQLLNVLYKAFKADLEAAGLTTTGGAYRYAAEKIEAGWEPFKSEKLIFVGFNALSVSEVRIFEALKEMRLPGGDAKADYIWDMAPRIFSQGDGPALKYVAVNSKRENFPPPDWIRPALIASLPDKAPDVKIIAVPSNVMQTKVAGLELASMFSEMSAGIVESEEEREERIKTMLKNARIAIVLPDENLLLPLLFSLPSQIHNPNLTMGFPLRHTPVIGFASLLRKLHQGAVADAGEVLYRFEDVKDFLGHPYSRLLFEGKAVETFIRGYERQRRVMVPLRDLLGIGERARMIFRVFSGDVMAHDIIDYILGVMALIREKFKSGAASEENSACGHGIFLRAEVEKVYVGTYIDSLIRLRNCVAEHHVPLTAKDVFTLADRMIGSESVVFDGRPLEGLQVMGVLETRCLDFDRIIMLSVNEKVIPKVGRNSTFIPNIIRSAFGIPPANYQEELFAYYFYRVLGRCQNAVLTYDSRASENRTPGPSRYLLQLKYLVDNIPLQEVEARFELPRSMQGDIVIEKSEALKPYLERYFISQEPAGENHKNFSASALNHFFYCQLRYLFADVLSLGEEREKIETIDSIDLGTIVHQVIECLYFPVGMRGIMLAQPILMTRAFLQGLLDEKSSGKGETRIERETRQAILRVHFGLEEAAAARGKLRGSAAIIFGYITEYIRNIIKADMARAPFRLWGSEIVRTLPYRIVKKDGSTVNIRFKMIIDRLDQEGGEGAAMPFRIVDYKTGTVHMEAENLDQVFDGTYAARNIFQLFFYAELLILLVKRGKIKLPAGVSPEDFELNLKVAVYRVPVLPDEEGIVVPSIGKTCGSGCAGKQRHVPAVGDLREIEREEGMTFMEKLESHLLSILDYDVPFSATPSEEDCARCDFKLRCEALRARNENKADKNTSI